MAKTRPDRDPDKLLFELGVDAPEQIDLEAIAEHCGATILYEKLEGCEARLAAGADRALITVSDALPRPRARFSAAHELAHWMLDRHRRSHACTPAMIDGRWFLRQPSRRNQVIEQRANRWAADLLMPERLFVPEILGYQQTLGTVRELAQQFGTSLIATALRLVRFGEFDSMLIWSRLGHRWKWFYRSPRMPVIAWPLDQPGPDSVAYRLLRGDRSDSGPELVKWHQWLDLSCMEYPSWYYLTEDSIRMRNGDVLSLLWFDDVLAMDALVYGQPPNRRKPVGERG